MRSAVEQIKEKLSIIDVVSSYIKLEKAGKYHKAKSPFSNEKTASFYVSPDRGLFYCFSTNQGGDMFTFVEKLEGVDFQGALRILADRAGVVLAHEPGRNKNENEKLYQIVADATKHFESNLKGNAEALAYLKKRGLTEKSITLFRIGYARNEWRDLYDALKITGHSDALIEKAGLIKKTEKGYYDRFRGRIIFPIRDSAGRTVAFSARHFEGSEDSAKYINSPETPLYHKSRILFGYDSAKSAIGKYDFSIVVEGQMDVLLSQQAGFLNTVAISGTALTEEQLTLLKRLSNNVVLALDADRAGVASAGKSAALALSLGMDVKVARLPLGVDPADLILTDKEAWRAALRESVHIVDFYLAYLAELNLDDRTYKRRVEEYVLPFLARITSMIDREHFITVVAKRIGVPEESVRTEVSRIAALGERGVVPRDDQYRNARPVSRRKRLEEALMGILFWQESLKDPHINIAELTKSIVGITGEERFNKLKDIPNEESQELSFRAELYIQDEGKIEREVDELLRGLAKEYMKARRQWVNEEHRKAESSGDSKRAQALQKESSELSKRIQQLEESEVK
ncbi:DNA primase [Candidatus Kaiserbacteria bacterium CG10_big_fil_rev_8_21_14_0_10_49_17]|uniref:DNA primase n=1 Tax=Candidatus Kaiserbacteria bacterium CG10_big_fil_rev_8_21_14_0_10_49_17 TaxID=1974609 RepID=A0A2M6WEW2_9BACT|nr:MAG: DNA primase [Candidatus Kaiserbacteria bacterium CG10_big_fil_rev_8_21_14_0_10_49_17]